MTAYQSASVLVNLFIVTSAVVMGGLASARVPYGRWETAGPRVRCSATEALSGITRWCSCWAWYQVA